MNILKYIGINTDDIIDSVGNVIDEVFTSDEERLIAKNKLAKINHEAKQKAKKLAFEYEKEVSKRWLSDNANLVTRLVRPLVVTFLYVLFGAVVLTDGNLEEFKINPSYIPLLENLLITVTIAYFGSRGLEKIKGVKNES